MIIDCNVLCYVEDKMGIGKEQDLWIPISIELNAIIAIKNNGEGTEISGTNRAVLYYGDNYFVTDLEFEEAKALWKQKDMRLKQV